MKPKDIEIGHDYAMAESNFRQRFCHVRVVDKGLPRAKMPPRKGSYRNSVLVEMVTRYDVILSWPTNMVTRRNLRDQFLGPRRWLVDPRLIVEPWDPDYHPKAIATDRERREAPLKAYNEARDDLWDFLRFELSDKFDSAELTGNRLASRVRFSVWDAVTLAETLRFLDEELPNWRKRVERRARSRRAPLIEAASKVTKVELAHPWRIEVEAKRNQR